MTNSPLPSLSNLPIGEVRYMESASSTNKVALMWIGQGAPDLSLVTADEQTAGRGRFDRRWYTIAGSALAFTLIVRPRPEEIASVRMFSPWAALALAQVLETDFGLRPQIKWPNDVLINGKKVSGILVETAWTGNQMDGAVIGVGINVSPAAIPPAAELRFQATCVEAEVGHPIDRWRLLRRVLEAMLAWRAKLGTADFLQAWENRLAFQGEWVIIQSGDGRSPDRQGRELGITAGGSLRLQGADGVEFTVEVGDVRLRLQI